MGGWRYLFCGRVNNFVGTTKQGQPPGLKNSGVKRKLLLGPFKEPLMFRKIEMNVSKDVCPYWFSPPICCCREPLINARPFFHSDGLMVSTATNFCWHSPISSEEETISFPKYISLMMAKLKGKAATEIASNFSWKCNPDCLHYLPPNNLIRGTVTRGNM